MKNSAGLKKLKDIPLKSLKDQRVLLRADFNVPVGDDGIVDDSEDWRIKAVLPTIKYLLKHNAKIILLAHLGRPNGKVQENLRLGPIQDKLSELLDLAVKKTPDCIGKGVEKAIGEIAEEEILLLENLRFYKEEEENDEKFARELASFGDLYINDAFSDSHRKHASIVGITKYLPSYAGFLMEKELGMMRDAINPKHPAVAIIGGAKLETKLPAVQSLAKIYDYILVGGMIANEINRNPNRYINDPNVILPLEKEVLKEKGYDIGSSAIKEFTRFLENAKSIVWNGPMGKFEENEYSRGTLAIVKAIKKAHSHGARILIGGGETINAVQKFAPELMSGKMNGFDKLITGNFNISTGGGAMLEFLAGKKLPGIEALKKQ